VSKKLVSLFETSLDAVVLFIKSPYKCLNKGNVPPPKNIVLNKQMIKVVVTMAFRYSPERVTIDKSIIRKELV
jgi:hypothetical protein